MAKPTLAILTESLRFDNQHPLKYFSKIKPVHFYKVAPYGDLKKEELKGAIQYRSFADLERKLLSLKPDIIQGAEPYGSKIQLRLSHLAWKVARELNIPLIFGMLENRLPKERFGPILAPMLKKVLAAYAKQASLIFYLNSGAKKNLLDVGADPGKLKKLLYGIWGIDTVLYKPEQVTRRNILFVGRLDEAKGIPYIMQAWEIIKREFPQVEFDFIANPGDSQSLVRGDRVNKIGAVANQDLPSYFASHLFTVVASVTLKRWQEQVGMVNLQSLACGRPVITTKSGAIPEYINSEVGILVPERNAKALAGAMRKLLSDDDLREKLGRTGREYILANFDAQKTIKKTEKILLGLLK